MPRNYPLPYAKCSVVACEGDANRPGSARGFCIRHYAKFQKYGDPLGKAQKDKAKVAAWIDDVAIVFDANECLIWPFYRNPQGYGVYTESGRPRIASRVICEKVHGPAPEQHHHAAHSCSNGHLGCVNPVHLSWKTPQQNEADKLSNGTSNRGQNHGLAKLKDADIRSIRAIEKKRGDVDEVAARYGVSRWTIFDIRSGRRWAHIQ